MPLLSRAGIAALGISLLAAHVAQAGIITTIEAPGVQTSSALDTTTETFNSVSTGYKNSQTFSLAGGLTATYSGTQFVNQADEYGGAGGVGNYLSLQATNSVTLTLSASQAYFGLWVSALDPYNQLQFYNGSQLLASYSGADPRVALLPASYLGNPNLAFLGQDPAENFVFVNFYAQSSADMFNKIVFSNLPGPTSFESDNHTFSATLQAPAVPEPSSLALCGIAGVIGLAVARARHKRAANV